MSLARLSYCETHLLLRVVRRLAEYPRQFEE
jgi:hypothetical protein